jgi:SAM-dependent methyltransferase
MYESERPTMAARRISLAHDAAPGHPRCVTAVPEEMLRHYAAVDENSRIRRGLTQLELLRTQELVRRFLPQGDLDIADIGGGPGVHAEWLAADGHRVHLVDPVPDHVETARALEPATGSIDAQLGEASSLPFADASMDAVLLLGPMYHLTDERDRLAALREALRVARPGAPLFVAAISRFASLLDGLGSKVIFNPEFRGIVEQDLRDGQHRNPTENPRWFTTAYLHHPDQLRTEATTAGIDVANVLGLEGITEWLRALSDDWDIPERRETIIWAARQLEAEPTLQGLSAHLLLIGYRPG